MAKTLLKYEGDNTTFIWKHPVEDFESGTILVVHESQEAIFFMNGEALDHLGPGKHELTTETIPLLARIFGKKGDSFHSQVYFINKSVQMSLKWGTDSKIRFLEPTYGIPVELGACGEMNLVVSDGPKLIVKLVGTKNSISWDGAGDGFAKSIQASFRPLISTVVKSNLPTSIKAANIDLVEIDEHLGDLSEILRTHVSAGFEEYGLTVPQFYITSIVLPENDINFKRLKELHTIAIQTRMARADATVRSAQADAEADVIAARRRAELERQTTETEIARRQAERDLIRAQADAQAARLAGLADAEVMRAKGYTQRDVMQAEVQMAYAEGLGNMVGSGSIAGEMIGMNMGMAAANAMNGQLGNLFTTPVTESAPAPQQEIAPESAPKEVSSKAVCTKCGAPLPEKAKFCLECGEKVSTPVPDGMVKCPTCGNTVPKGKFCPECGHKFVLVCPNCGKEGPTGAKFCLECGTKY